MGNQKQIANSEEKKSREGHRQLPGCQRGLSNAASGGDRRYLVRQTIPTTSADTTCPKHTRNGGKNRTSGPSTICELRTQIEQKLEVGTSALLGGGVDLDVINDQGIDVK